MSSKVFLAALSAAFMLVSAGAARADEDVRAPKKPVSKAQQEAKARAQEKRVKERAKAAAAAKARLVDINSATRDQLKAIPGLAEADVDKIIAGRPYLTKAHLVTKNAVSADVYQAIRGRIAALQPTTSKR
jgi:DNA uptake protein ComE-like DNA-binding protein